MPDSTNEPGGLPPGPLLGIDFGTVRVGLAICDRDQKMAFPLMILQRQNTQQEAEFYTDLIKKERITGIVMGLPVHLSGTESPKSKQVRQYGNWLTKTTGLPVAYCDERFTSAFAWEELKAGGLKASQRKKQLDKVAAQMMLQTFLDTPRNLPPNTGVESLDHPNPER
ncbi:MAG TPA: Holliday junction resolvase RuvX [Gemmatales bacterium]|nr:Holliday junction resolvase RuvX [Gemmatales bacterium]